MKTRTEDYDYTDAATVAGPLFDEPVADPFECSKEKPSEEQRKIAEILWRSHSGWRNAISGSSLAEMTYTTPREIKAIVEALRNTHKCAIGSRHEEPAGYYRIQNEEDRKMAVGPYHSQMMKMWGTLKVLGTRQENQRLLDRMREES